MKLLYRLGYYLVGLSLGMLIVSFVFSGKKTSCNYGPNARVLAAIRKKKLLENNSIRLHGQRIDSVLFHQLLAQAKVDFSESNTQLDSCRVYRIQSYFNKISIALDVENCTQNVSILKLHLQD
ncbi:MAG: hypothetical protein ACON47_06495 [Flavobacteriaceae bacterium]